MKDSDTITSFDARRRKLTRQEAAAHLRVHPHTLDRWTAHGYLHPIRYPSPTGSRPTIRYSIDEIERFERESESR